MRSQTALKTLLKGVPSSFTLELPPYRKPQFVKVIVRSVFDRTLFVLGRAAAVAAPAGVVIWLMANIPVNGDSLLHFCAEFLDPFARIMGLDGIILIAFILGFPANEIVIPIIIMAYMAQGSLLELGSLCGDEAALSGQWLDLGNGYLYHALLPDALALLYNTAHHQERNKSWKWTALAAAIPTALGVVSCILFATLAKLFC